LYIGTSTPTRHSAESGADGGGTPLSHFLQVSSGPNPYGISSGLLRLSAIHVIGSNKASFDEIEAVRAAVDGADYHTVLNSTNRSKFDGLPASVKDPIRVPLLEERTAADVDMQSVGFSAYYANLDNGMVKRGYVNSWLKPVFAEYDRKKLNALYSD
jgi:hypothetical protein